MPRKYHGLSRLHIREHSSERQLTYFYQRKKSNKVVNKQKQQHLQELREAKDFGGRDSRKRKREGGERGPEAQKSAKTMEEEGAGPRQQVLPQDTHPQQSMPQSQASSSLMPWSLPRAPLQQDLQPQKHRQPQQHYQPLSLPFPDQQEAIVQGQPEVTHQQQQQHQANCDTDDAAFIEEVYRYLRS